MEIEKRITSSDFFGEPDALEEPGDKFEQRKLRREISMNFMEEVEDLVRSFKDKRKPRKGLKQTLPLDVDVAGRKFQIRAIKDTEPRELQEEIFYIFVDYKLEATDENNITTTLFKFRDTKYPDINSPSGFRHGDTEVTNAYGKKPTVQEAHEALWSIRFLGEQLEAKYGQCFQD